MLCDPETVPVVVGAGRYTQRKGEVSLEDALSPVDMMQRASALAELDSGFSPGELLATIDAVATVESATRTRAILPPPAGLGVDLCPNMPRSLAVACGALAVDDEKCFLTHAGGNSAQWLVNEMADQISKGEISSALLAGCEVHASLMAALKAGGTAPAALGARWKAPDADNRRAEAVRIGPAYVETEIEKRHGAIKEPLLQKNSP